MRRDIDRRNLLKSALFLSVLGGCDRMMGPRPVLNLALGQSIEFINAHSTLTEPGSDHTPLDVRFITSPHEIIYKDARLTLRLPDCGAQVSMPTSLSFENDKLVSCDASVLGDYVDVATAADKARALAAEFRRQRFVYVEKDKFARLATLDSNGAPGVAVPKAIASESGIEELFLNPDFGVASIIVFQLHSGPLLADLRMTNMRRKFHDNPDEDLRAQDHALSRQAGKGENVYYLELDLSVNDLS
ncbi:MAG TPA: hypothetical protein VFV07_02330 [Rhizomicrobium sp.]|nr:hypothetical protein [Rhizomicrobium sp.]